MDVLWRLLVLFHWFPTMLLTLVFLSVATYYDVRYREIDLKLFLAMMPAGVLGYVFLLPRLSLTVMFASFTVTCVVATATYFFARKGVMGEGDPFLVAVVGVLNPYVVNVWGLPVTPLMLTLMLGTVYVLALMVVNVVYNTRHIDVFTVLTRDTGVFEKIYYFLVGRVMSVEEFKGKKFYFPLVTVDSRRLVARVGYEPLEGSEYGDIKGSYLIVSHGFAFAALLLVGYVLYLVLIFSHPTTCVLSG